jgi:hypothetical protein
MAKKSGKSAAKQSSPPKPSKPAKSRAIKPTSPRRIRLPDYKWYKIHKPVKHPVKLPSVFKLTKAAFQLVWNDKKTLLLVVLIYGLLNFVFVKGLSGGADMDSLKQTFGTAFDGHFGSLASGLGIFVALISSSGNTSSDTAGAYQSILVIVASLALIWCFRQLMAGTKIRARDAYYKGMYPLVPFILVVAVIGLQTVPLWIGATLYSTVITNGIAVGSAQLIWLLPCLLLGALTIYMIISSVFALYIVTLPDMTPLKALRSARKLVRFRRGVVLLKLLWMIFILLFVAAVIMLPIIILITALAPWIFFVLTMTALLAVHAYIYTLYRELLNE